MRPWCLLSFVAMCAFGCARPDNAPVLQSGDVIRPELSFAPKAPWPADAKVMVGMLARVERPDGTSRYLMDKDLDIELAEMHARITFRDGERVLGDPMEVPLAHDC